MYNYGILDKTETKKISLDKNGSSIYKNGKNNLEIKVIDILEWWEKENIQKIDLIKINIEGGEYSLLKRMIDTGLVKKCENIQVQFHKFIPNAIELRTEIRTLLSKTHTLTYDYPFVWENWQIKK